MKLYAFLAKYVQIGSSDKNQKISRHTNLSKYMQFNFDHIVGFKNLAEVIKFMTILAILSDAIGM